MIEIRYYRTADDRVPVTEWLDDLDRVTSERIDVYIDRMQLGNFSNSRSVGQGIVELKIDFGPGYRVYYLRDGDAAIVLLCGGDKGSQKSDIAKAHQYSEDYWRQKHET